MISKQNEVYLNEVKKRINKFRGKINSIIINPTPEKYKLVFLSGGPTRLICGKELLGKKTEGSIVSINGVSYKIIKRLKISSKIFELHLDDV
jgi:hypothetical protein